MPFHTAVLVPEQPPLRQWYATLTLFGAVADHVSIPLFVNETETTLLDPATMVDGVLCARQLTRYGAGATLTVRWRIEAVCHENQVTSSRIRSYCRQNVPDVSGA